MKIPLAGTAVAYLTIQLGDRFRYEDRKGRSHLEKMSDRRLKQE